MPVLANLMPAGTALMEDFHFAGGLVRPAEADRSASRHQLPQHHRRQLGDAISNAKYSARTSIRPPDNRGIEGSYRRCNHNLAPRGVSCAVRRSPHLLAIGPAVVFENFAADTAGAPTRPISTSAKTRPWC